MLALLGMLIVLVLSLGIGFVGMEMIVSVDQIRLALGEGELPPLHGTVLTVLVGYALLGTSLTAIVRVTHDIAAWL